MNRKLYGLIAFACIGLSIFIFSGCPNFMEGNEIKDVINTEVAEANAQQVSVRVQPLSSDMGTTNPSGVTTVKVGIPFTISMTANADYAFTGWDSPSNALTFSDAATEETTALLSQAEENIIIVANYNARPAVIGYQPYSQSGVLRNQTITLLFSEAVDPSKVTFDNITVVAKPIIDPTAEPTDMTGRLEDPIVSGSNVEIPFQSGQSFDGQSQVVVTVKKTITDLDNHMMPADFSWPFSTGSNTDGGAPIINGVTITIDINGAEEIKTLANSGFKTESLSMGIMVDASDDVEVASLYIVETQLTDNMGNAVGTESQQWQRDYENSTYEYTFPFADTNDGKKRLDFTVYDPPLNASATVSIEIILDKTSPSITNWALTGTGPYGTETNITVNPPVEATDPGAPAYVGGVSHYAVTYSSAEPASGDWIAYTGAVSAVQLPAGPPNDTPTVYFHAKDALGNRNSAFIAGVNVDETPPTITFALSDTHTKNPSAVSATISGTDSNDLVEYAFTDGTNPSSWEVWPNDPLGELWAQDGTPIAITMELPSSTEGPQDVTFFVKDSADNVASAGPEEITVDTTSPSIDSFTADGGTGPVTTNGDTVDLAFTLNDGTGVGDMEYQITITDPDSNTTTPTTWTDTDLGDGQSGSVSLSNYSLEATPTDGDYIITLEARDQLLNTPVSSDSITVVRDTTSPSITSFTADGGTGPVTTNGDSVDLAFTLNDGTGVGDMEYQITITDPDSNTTITTTWTDTDLGDGQSGSVTLSNYALEATPTDGDYIITLEARDQLLNTVVPPASITVIRDTVKPTLGTTDPVATYVDPDMILTVYVNESSSGVFKIKYWTTDELTFQEKTLGAPVTGTNEEVNCTLNLSGLGTDSFSFRLIDDAGNVSADPAYLMEYNATDDEWQYSP